MLLTADKMNLILWAQSAINFEQDDLIKEILKANASE